MAYPKVTSRSETPSFAGATYSYAETQNAISIANTGTYDLRMFIGGYTDVIIHPHQTWANTLEFDDFTVNNLVFGETGAFTATITCDGTSLARASNVEEVAGFVPLAAVANVFAIDLGYKSNKSVLIDIPYDILQRETLTVGVGTITANPGGDATVTATVAGMAGSPLAITVPVLLNDITSVIATKIRAALVATAVFATRFTVGGTGADVVITSKTYQANDATLNLAITTGTATGITQVPSSTNTTAGAVAAKEVTIANVADNAILSIELVNESPVAITWPNTIVWPTGAEPNWTTGGTYIIRMVTHNAGTSWLANVDGFINKSMPDPIELKTGQKIFTGSAANETAVFAEVGAVDATGSLYISSAGGLYIQVANAGADADWNKVTSTHT